MKNITLALYSMIIINILFAMDEPNFITFFNKDIPHITLHVTLLNIETDTLGNYSHSIKPKHQKIFNLENIIFMKKPRLFIHNAEPQTIKLNIRDKSNNIITITMDDRYITVTNKDNAILAQSIRTDQANSSLSREEI